MSFCRQEMIGSNRYQLRHSTRSSIPHSISFFYSLQFPSSLTHTQSLSISCSSLFFLNHHGELGSAAGHPTRKRESDDRVKGRHSRALLVELGLIEARLTLRFAARGCWMSAMSQGCVQKSAANSIPAGRGAARGTPTSGAVLRAQPCARPAPRGKRRRSHPTFCFSARTLPWRNHRALASAELRRESSAWRRAAIARSALN